MTESEVFEILTIYLGRKPSDKEEARAGLRKMIKESPGWLYTLPESLLEKIGVKYDHVFDVKDMDLAKAIGGKCEIRIYN